MIIGDLEKFESPSSHRDLCALKGSNSAKRLSADRG